MPRKKSASKKAQIQAGKNPELEVENTAKPKNTVKQAEAESGSGSGSEDESSESEIEDEFGELLTENVEKSIQKVMETIKKDPKKLLDPEAKFFDDDGVEIERKSADKPLYLKDYHRKNLLSGDYKDESDNENEYGTVDGEKPYAVVEKEERDKLLADINDAFDGEEEEDDFMKKKEASSKKAVDAPLVLPDSKSNPDDFLQSFLSNEAWIPKKNDKVINLDQIDKDDEQDFDDAVEEFENAFNFRYEDPNSAEIVSYARTQATLRRGKTNSRKRAREKKIAIKEQEKHEVEQALQKKKKSKVNKVLDRLKKIKEAVGDEIDDEVVERVFGDSLMNDDFDDADWDNKMAEIFNEQYYDAEMEKPDWGDDDELMAEFHAERDEGEDDEEVNEGEEKEENEGEEDDEDGDEENEETEIPKKLTKKDKLKQKKSAKKEIQSLKEKAQKLVDANTLKIKEEVEEERGRAREDDVKFKYREVSPESFGLSTREIFLADDQDLNKFISIKKFAPYKPKDVALKEKRKFTKKKHLQQWRSDVFKDKQGPARHTNEQDDEIWIPNEDSEQPKKKKSKKSKH